MMRLPAQRRVGITALVILLVATGLFITRLGERVTSQPTDATVSPEPAVPVELVPVAVGPVTETATAVGTLEANESVLIRPELPGLVTQISFQEGQAVDQGAVLIELDDAELRAQTAQAAAQERIARSTYERLQRLNRNPSTIVPPQQLDEARSALQAAEANTVAFAERLKKTKLRAPFAGTLGLRRVSPGDYVRPGQDLVNLEDLRTLKIDFKVPETFLRALFVGQPVTVETDAYPGETFSGEIYAVDPRVEAVNRALHVRARVPNPDGKLRPGLFARVTVILTRRDDALLIPEEAVVFQGDKSFVYRVIDRVARRTEVTLGARAGTLVHVRSGLDRGDVVVRAGHHKLKDGLRIAGEVVHRSP
ncbi:MAG: efflux RND transporter periplasmic adaptor subunit [Nitrospirota bacterium]